LFFFPPTRPSQSKLDLVHLPLFYLMRRPAFRSPLLDPIRLNKKFGYREDDGYSSLCLPLSLILSERCYLSMLPPVGSKIPQKRVMRFYILSAIPPLLYSSPRCFFSSYYPLYSSSSPDPSILLEDSLFAFTRTLKHPGDF